MIENIVKNLKAVREKKPLIHHITNYVTVNDCANIVLAIGASPIMADDIDEVETITALSSALVLNIGTLDRRTVTSMFAAGKKANELHIPVILDPVGAGISTLRNQTVMQLLQQVRIAILRGNMSEIRFVAGLHPAARGVDASETDQNSSRETERNVAEEAAAQFGCVTAITGATDIVSDGQRTIYIENGTASLRNVTGTGCMCTSLAGAFCGAATDGALVAAAGGILCMGIAGELAEESIGAGGGNGSFHVAIFDEISKLNAETLRQRAKIHEA